MDRKAACERKTKETDISLSLNIDGSGRTKIDTGIGFLTICWMVLQDTACLIWRLR